MGEGRAIDVRTIYGTNDSGRGLTWTRVVSVGRAW